MQVYKEAEVRFHFIDPLIRRLGYPGGEAEFLHLEEKLEYPYFHIGHRSKKRDQPLGFPDYRAGLKGRRGSFVVEAKSQKAGFGPVDVEQAHSYAAHAQVGANYFVLCDGRRLAIYETLSGPSPEPLVEMSVDEIDGRFHEIENILSPASLARNCQVQYDKGLKLCDGLGSSVKISSGVYDMKAWDYRLIVAGSDVTDMLRASVPEVAQIDKDLTMMQQDFESRVSNGVAERDAQGRIHANVTFAGVTKNNAEMMKLLGIKDMKFATDSAVVSVKPEEPTLFESTAEFSVERGTMMPPMFGAAVPAEVDATGDVLISARMHKAGVNMLGEYLLTADYWLDLPGMGRMKAELDVAGEFSLELDI